MCKIFHSFWCASHANELERKEDWKLAGCSNTKRKERKFPINYSKLLLPLYRQTFPVNHDFRYLVLSDKVCLGPLAQCWGFLI